MVGGALYGQSHIFTVTSTLNNSGRRSQEQRSSFTFNSRPYIGNSAKERTNSAQCYSVSASQRRVEPVQKERVYRVLNGTEQTVERDSVSRIRSKDVAHVWKVEPRDKYGQLRNRVSESLLAFTKRQNISSTVGFVSRRGKIGRTTVSENYVKALLDHKIIVVSQEISQWEGHLRIFEAPWSCPSNASLAGWFTGWS